MPLLEACARPKGGQEGKIISNPKTSNNDNETVTLPETNIAHENPIFPGKRFIQNVGFSMA